MRILLALLVWSLRAALRSRGSLALENLTLRQQLAAYARGQKCPRLKPQERAFWVTLSRLWASCRDALIIVKPATGGEVRSSSFSWSAACITGRRAWLRSCSSDQPRHCWITTSGKRDSWAAWPAAASRPPSLRVPGAATTTRRRSALGATTSAGRTAATQTDVFGDGADSGTFEDAGKAFGLASVRLRSRAATTAATAPPIDGIVFAKPSITSSSSVSGTCSACSASTPGISTP